jgi:hypothetical protein
LPCKEKSLVELTLGANPAHGVFKKSLSVLNLLIVSWKLNKKLTLSIVNKFMTNLGILFTTLSYNLKYICEFKIISPQNEI